jgi:hypothetical protein
MGRNIYFFGLVAVDTAAYHAELAFNKQVKEQNLVELLASHNNLVMGA